MELTPQAFVERWSKSTLSEKSASQQHFLDLCRMLHQPSPAEADPEGSFYTFEKGVEKTGGGKGFADVWYKGRFAWEYKGKHKDLVAAYNQLLLYREDLENPPLLVVSDMERYEVHTNFTGTVPRVYRFTNRELPEPENLRVLRAMFEDPYSLRPTRTVEGVTEEAARKFARLADGMRARGVEPHEAAHFLNKLLFCLFAEDIGLLPKGLFTRVAERTAKDPDRFTSYIGDLFVAMRDGGDFLLEDIRRFNGGLYESGEVVPLTSEELRQLVDAARLDWGAVEPAIFGTLFERSLDPSQRARLGAHYTSHQDILAVVEPVLIAPLRREWEEVREQAEAEAETARNLSGQKAVNALRRAERQLGTFAERLRGVRVLDPACGSGNFLYVSLKELLDLEKEVSTFAGTVGLTPFFPEVSPEQLYGIETSPYAHELAQVAIWIGYLQWRVENGFGTRQEPILGPMTNIKEMDALMLCEENGELREPEWPEADVIVGNPPFLGDKKMRTELGDEYVINLRNLYGGRVPGGADLVTYWFERTRKKIEDGRVKRAGLLATNSISGGINRRVLERIKQTGNIFMAWRDRPWVVGGASVRVAMLGFDDGTEQIRYLDDAPVANISADLHGDVDVTGARRLPENAKLAFVGDTKKGKFEITRAVANKMLEAPLNPNGKSNSEVVRPWINASDITRRPRDMWIIDFGVDMAEEEAALYEKPYEHVRQNVKPARDLVRNHLERTRWWLHGRPAPDLRDAIGKLGRYIGTPIVSKYRLFVWVDSSILPDHAAAAIARDDDYFFGVLHSRAHELWSLRTITYLGIGNDPRYTPSRTFETFPFPWPPNKEPANEPLLWSISEAAQKLDQLRRNWLNPKGATEAELKKRTLTNLYNARPTWLANAHDQLDRAVLAAYGWPTALSEEEILKNLLALNLERSEGKQGRSLPEGT
ncbi:MAG: class I SAM-dependent DNA methyltransferase [Rubrobacter sp.]|nr:class I SAM-dependent DNA methyltransferase [Rubrobacter sp.]